MFCIEENKYKSIREDLRFDDYFEYKQIKTNKQITYYNDVVAFDIESTSFNEFDPDYFEHQDTGIYDYLHGLKIRINERVYKEMPDFNSIRRQLFGRLYFSKHEGIAPDVLYSELSEQFPYYFPDDIINPFDQLCRIIDVFIENSPEKPEEETKRALMYVWQIAINGKVIIGRTWEEFSEMLDAISKHLALDPKRRLIIWVHNLAFEFQFMKDLFTWEKVFAISTRKPIYALTTTGIEFRCSYILSNLSLANVGKSLKKYKVKKLEGDLDYRLIRHSETPLTDDELNYCINDVLVVSAYIKESMEQSGDNITRLPLTSTGYCRNYVRNNCLVGEDKHKQFRKYHKMISRLKIESVEEYMQMLRAFQGGFTHCSSRHSMHVLHDVDAFDFTSSYPFALISSKNFPMSKGKKVEVKTYKELKEYCRLYCCIFDIKFTNIKPKIIFENYISCSKCFELKNPVTNNGRLVGADVAALTITNIDMDIIEKFYTWDSVSIGVFRIYKRDYLPREIIMSILKLYKDKTELKGVEGMEDFYTKGKQLLNAIFGMCCTSVIMPLHTFKDGQWTIEEKEAEKELKKYNNSKKRFLSYPWGIFCTAIARRNLISGILEFNDDYIYCDTDSLYVINADKHMNYINGYNALVRKQLETVSKHYNIPFEYFEPVTIKGEKKLIGVWEQDTVKHPDGSGGKYKMFKSLGAKRYLKLTADDELTLTVSGVNKKAAIPYLLEKYGKEGAFDAFTNELIIPAAFTGKLTHTYIDYETSGQICDYLGNTIQYKSKSGVYLEEASYSFSMEAAYLQYLKEIHGRMFA